MKKFSALVFFLLASVFLFLNADQAHSAPPQEKYKFTDVKTIVGNDGEFLEPVVFDRVTGNLGDSEFNPGSAYRPKTRALLKSGCYLLSLEINFFNSDGTQGRLVEYPLSSQPNIKLCDVNVQQSFRNKTIMIDTSAIKTKLVKDISVTVNVKTTAHETKQIPPTATTDDITIEGPSNNPNFPSELRAGHPVGSIKDAGIIKFEIHSPGHEPGDYKACSKIAQNCATFTKIPTETAKVTIDSTITIEGVRTGSGLKGEKCVNTLDCASPLNCVDKKCTDENPDPTVPPAPSPPCPAGKWENGKCTAFITALGEFSTDPAGFITSVFGILLAAAGGIALLLIIRAGYKILTSQGKPEAIQEGKDQIVSAIVGLLFLIFSLVFLQVIGVDILRIPGLGNTSTPNNPGLSLPDVKPNPINISTCSQQLIRSGSSGGCVEAVQRMLNISPDGQYGPITEDAVRKYQASKGIFVDGSVGPCTWGRFLDLPVHSVCSSPLNDAVIRQFQTENGLVIDGRLGTCTWNALMGDAIPDNCKRR
ncbi:MAG TPA: peptidoglycan-binding protein [Xanthomonadales bacterium]|nr:peptidoglycan-binding protein [Xanthomonadales bacterium]